MAIRWYAARATNPARASGALYASNTAGAAIGSLLAGFVLIPSIGLGAATRVGIGVTSLAVLMVLLVARTAGEPAVPAPVRAAGGWRRRQERASAAATPAPQPWLGLAVLGLSGFAALTHEIAWTRLLALLLGPTTYAFAAALAAVIAGVAIGSTIGSWLAGRSRRPAAWLAFALAAAAVATSWTSAVAGSSLPLRVAERMAAAGTAPGAPGDFDEMLRQGVLMTAGLILPTAIAFGAAFPLALALLGASSERAARPFGIVYAVNTLGAVGGSLAAGFILIPDFGLQQTLTAVSACAVAAAVIVIVWGRIAQTAQAVAMAGAVTAVSILAVSPAWNRDLLTSGAYLYAPYVPKDLDLAAQLEAGTLLYYRDGAASTVSVKRLTGTTTLAVDGKVDASNRSDMLTQKLLAHLPLLLHERPRTVGIIGLGSGVTLGAALRHPIEAADVIEISPEVVEASQYFNNENHLALDDPRTRLIVGDGRSHLLLSNRRYDVIVSEPSNPWIAGVAALFTREFFEAARDRLAPGGLICQWAHTYNISDRDLRSIVATFTSVFPNGTLWLVGEDDILLVAGDAPIDARLDAVARHWSRPGVADDLAEVSVADPFSILSLYAGGPAELARYAGDAPVLTDDRLSLEFSGPRELHRRSAAGNASALEALLDPEAAPAAVREARAAAGAAEWRHRGDMLFKADVHARAFDDYTRALQLDPADTAALDGMVRTALLLGREIDALGTIRALDETRGPTTETLVATSKLLAAAGSPEAAVETAEQAASADPVPPAALEQLASLFAAREDVGRLDEVVARLRGAAPEAAATEYYAAVAEFLRGKPDDAVRLAERSVALDPDFAPVHDLAGAAYSKLGQLDKARDAFNASLEFDAHDSTAYTNLGLVELASGNRAAAADYFAEALWLTPDSRTAREGLERAR
jgi:spermidine synthase